MTVQFKMNMDRCSEFAGSEFKDCPAGAAAAIRTSSAPSNAEPTTPIKGTSSNIDVVIWKEEYTEYKRKERIWAQTNPRIFNMILGQCTQEIKVKLEGRDGWPVILEAQDGVGLLKALHRLCNQQDGGSTRLMEIVLRAQPRSRGSRTQERSGLPAHFQGN